MTPERWDMLMTSARSQATAFQQRQRVHAFKLPPRASAFYRERWAYLIIPAPERPDSNR